MCNCTKLDPPCRAGSGCGCLKNGKSCTQSCACKGRCGNPKGVHPIAAADERRKMLLDVLEGFEPEGDDDPLFAELRGDPPSKVVVPSSSPNGLDLGCHYECLLTIALSSQFKLPTSSIKVKPFLKDYHEDKSWTKWKQIRDKVAILKVRPDHKETRIRGMFLSQDKELCLVRFTIPKEITFIQSEGGTLTVEDVTFLNVVPVISLEKLTSPVWPSCLHGCGGIHLSAVPCPRKTEKVKEQITEQQKLLKERQIRSEKDERLDPRFYCAFGTCEDLYHPTLEMCCESIRKGLQDVIVCATDRAEFETKAVRPQIRIVSWNVQKMGFASNAKTKGFTSSEKAAMVGFPNAVRPWLEEENKLKQQLRDNLRAEIESIQPDVICLQEVPEWKNFNVEQFLLNELGLVNGAHSYKCRAFKATAADSLRKDGREDESSSSATEEDGFSDDSDSLPQQEQQRNSHYFSRPEQHVFIWNTETMDYSKNPADYLDKSAGLKLKHGAPTMAFKHRATGKHVFVTSVHLECGSKGFDVEKGCYPAARNELVKLLGRYRSIPMMNLATNMERSVGDATAKGLETGDHIHVIAGDFNLNPHILMDEVYPDSKLLLNNANSSLFEVKDPEVKTLFAKSQFTATGNKYTVTNAGQKGRGYDFFLVDETAQRFVSLTQKVLRASLSKAGGHVGLSDHDPVVLEMCFHEKYSAEDKKTFREKMAGKGASSLTLEDEDAADV